MLGHSSFSVVLHLVIGADDISYETGPLTFDQVVAQVRDGQYGDVRHILSVSVVNGTGHAEDVTNKVAEAIFNDLEHTITYGTEVYTFIERELSVWHAQLCCSSADNNERRYEQRQEHQRRKS